MLYVYTSNLDVVLDPDKDRENLKKHGVCFSDTEMMLFEPNALPREDIGSERE
jgi:uncharacterized DUF497 family protein